MAVRPGTLPSFLDFTDPLSLAFPSSPLCSPPVTYADTSRAVFIQSSPSFPSDDPNYDPLRDSFGLVDKSPSRWKRFKRAIERLNEESDERTSVKVLWVARHGQVRFPLPYPSCVPLTDWRSPHPQGYHNVAETKYGTPEWDRYWSKLDGDGELTARSFSSRATSFPSLTSLLLVPGSGVPTLS